MFPILIVYPSCQHTFALSVHEHSFQDFIHLPFVLRGQNIKRGFAIIVVTDGYLTSHDIWQRIDKH